jgi:hypothetical protein
MGSAPRPTPSPPRAPTAPRLPLSGRTFFYKATQGCRRRWQRNRRVLCALPVPAPSLSCASNPAVQFPPAKPSTMLLRRVAGAGSAAGAPLCPTFSCASHPTVQQIPSRLALVRGCARRRQRQRRRRVRCRVQKVLEGDREGASSSPLSPHIPPCGPHLRPALP